MITYKQDNRILPVYHAKCYGVTTPSWQNQMEKFRRASKGGCKAFLFQFAYNGHASAKASLEKALGTDFYTKWRWQYFRNGDCTYFVGIKDNAGTGALLPEGVQFLSRHDSLFENTKMENRDLYGELLHHLIKVVK